MRRRTVLGGMVAAVGAVGPSGAAPRVRAVTATSILNTLAMPVTPAENRQYSYTDKVSGYFHGRTQTDTNPDWFNGWNIATKRIFQDYALSVDAVALSRASANVTVSPHKMVRRLDGATETLSLLDGLSVLVLDVSDVRGDTIGVALKGDLTDAGTLGPEEVWFLPKEATGTHLLVAPITPQAVTLDPARGVTAPKSAGGFYLIHAPTKPEARAILSRVRRGATQMLADRASRMEALVSGNNALDAGDTDRTKALLWMRLTTDQLVMKQMGTGIYAGLPWFNDYWGRDTFISITGALFVTGQYDIAADVFRSFAALQDMDPTSKTYGRVPNRARPDGIEYNSADGTPRFIITLADLVSRSGNVVLARELWPAVKRAVEGVLKNNVDSLGLITHEDADTWMDAKEKGVRAWSPRGNRAIDVQALWVEASRATSLLAFYAGFVRPQPVIRNREPAGPEDEFLAKVRAFGERLRDALSAHFINYDKSCLADHLSPDGTQDTKLRPNALFALSQVAPKGALLGGNPMDLLRQKMVWVRQIWEGLVYPWGVATLAQSDPDFYPYHEHWHYYHKDAAYHNGTVWPWLNGAAMDALLNFGVVNQPWQLFENMNRQALKEGAIGSLAECADALPLPEASWARRTGTFLQAWSNAEHLRVWYEGFLGINTKLGNQFLEVAPRLPPTVRNIKMSIPLGAGVMRGVWHDGSVDQWRFDFEGADCKFAFGLPEIDVNGSQSRTVYTPLLFWDLKAGQTVTIVREGLWLNWKVADVHGQILQQNRQRNWMIDAESTTAPNPVQTTAKQVRAIRNEIFAGIDFCKPRLNPNLKSLSVRHDPPLTY